MRLYFIKISVVKHIVIFSFLLSSNIYEEKHCNMYHDIALSKL